MKNRFYYKWLIIVSNIILVAGLMLPFISTVEARKLAKDALAAQASEEVNLLQNAGFEEYTGENGIADEWEVAQDEVTTGEFQVVKSPVASGNFAQKIAGTGIPKGKEIKIFQKVKIEGDKAYRLSGSLRAASLSQSTVELGIEFFDKEGNSLDSQSVQLETDPKDEYVLVSKRGTTPLDVDHAKIYSYLKATDDGADGTYYVDDLKLTYETEDTQREPLATPANFKANPTASRVVLEWDEVKGAVSYVYIA